MKTTRVVMKDIAEKAGVHQTTVSLALNNDRRISKSTADRVRKIAEEMGYIPDPILTSLVSYRNKTRVLPYQETIALIFDTLGSYGVDDSLYLRTVRNAVIQRAKELGYKIEILRRGVDYASSATLDRILRTRSIHGILFGDIYGEDLEYKLDWDEYSMVKITQAPFSLPIDSVMGNYFFSARTVMRNLKNLGYRRPAMAGSIPEETHTRNLYRAGFEYGQRRHYAPEHHIPFYEFQRKTEEEIEEEVFTWLKEVKPDVLMSYWNNLCRPAFRLTQSGHNCRFVSLEADDQSICFGGIRNNFKKMAETAIELLISKMRMNVRGLPNSPNLILVEEKWIDLGPWPESAEIFMETSLVEK